MGNSRITPPPAASSLLTVVVTDLVDSTRIVSEVGDHAAHAALQRHDRLARDLLAEHDGREIDKSDGFLLLFEQPAAAVTFALRYHEALRALSIETGVQWRARVGIQLGEVFVSENSEQDIARGAKPLEVEGLAKPLAARLMGLARGGQTLLGAVAFDLAQRGGVELPGLQLGWLAHGRYLVKGSELPIEVFEVGVIGHAPLQAPADSAKARRELSDDDRLTLGWRPGPGIEVPMRAPWRLSRKLGAGGFGEVWLAEHPQTGGRHVFKFCHDAERLRSLKREVTVFRLLREALGSRDDIARIIDWQLDTAPFFIEVEYVAGGDLAGWAQQQGGLQQVEMDQRIEIAAQAAEALAAAHSVGILHKDIKPGNILIRQGADGRPQAALADFGIGMVTDRRQLLAHGITVAGLTDFLDGMPTGGSQLYMAPETLQGKAATIQADIYALGVVLYELVAGEFKPLAPGWQRDVSCELLAADIEALVDGDPGRRPASAAAVARGLRQLAQRRQQLVARRKADADAEATRQALARAQQRRKRAVGLSAALVAVLAAVSFSAWQAAIARDEAELRRSQAEQLIGFMLDDLRDRLKQVGRLDVMASVGAAAMDYFESIPADRLGDDDLAARAKALYQIGDDRVAQGDLEGAAHAMAESLELAGALAARAPEDPQRQFDLAQSHYWAGYVAFRREDLATAMMHFEHYRQIAEWLIARDPDKPEWQAELGYAHSNIGSVLEEQGDFERAATVYRLELDRRLSMPAGDSAARLGLAVTHNKLGRVLQKQLRLEQALAQFRSELEQLDGLAAESPDNAHVRVRQATAQYYLTKLLWSTGDESAAQSLYPKSEANFRALVEQDSDNRRWRRDLVMVLQFGAELALQQGMLDSAEQRLAAAERYADAIDEHFPAVTVVGQLLRAELVLARRPPRVAALIQPLAEAALSTLTQQPATRELDELVARAHLLRGTAIGMRQQQQAAVQAFSAGLAVLQAKPGPDPDNQALQVRLLLALGDLDSARAVAGRLFANGYRGRRLVDECLRHGIRVPPPDGIRSVSQSSRGET